MTNWKTLLIDALAENGEDWSDIEIITLSDAQLLREFDHESCKEEGDVFTAWTSKRVYFPVSRYGREWASSISRHPDGKPTSHLDIGE